MTSQSQEEGAGPSGLAHHEVLAMLGLETSDSEKEEETNLLCPEEMMRDNEMTSCHGPLLSHEELPDSDDDLCHEAMAHFERQHTFQTRLLQQSGVADLDEGTTHLLQQSGAGGLDEGTFDFELQPFVNRTSRRMGVRERHFKTQLRQRGNLIADQNITQALQDGLRRAVNQVLTTTPDLHDQDRLYFTIASDRLHNNFQGWGLRAGEWRRDTERVEALFQSLAQALNSNEQFEMDDSFQVSITQVHHAPQGTGKPRRGKPGHPTMAMLTVNKNSVIRIQNDDELCCARALVVAKARVDQHPKQKAIREGRPLQRTLALDLQHEAKVPFGPCSYDALTAFSKAPSLTGYQILLVDAQRSFHITTFGPLSDKQLILLHNKDHYDVITKLPGFFGSSYVCAACWKPYDHEGMHRCTKTKLCGACRQKDCPDFQHAYPRHLKATQRCKSCHRDFFGPACFEAHSSKTHAGKPTTDLQASVCSQRYRCPDCYQQNVGLSRIQRHHCWHVDCPSCHQYVHADDHRCFIQKAPKPQDEKKKRKRTRQKGPRAKRGPAAEPHASSEDEDDLPPLHVSFDIEAMQPHEEHIANLVVAETEDKDEPKPFPGPTCIRDFLEWLDTLTNYDTRQVNVIAHNFQGYDGYFIIQEYYGDNRIVQQLRNGCKLLEIKHDHIRFIDSMSFFQMPLSAFPKTFGLTELCKGYFPHKFNIPGDEHQHYVGILPSRDYYMPETMSLEGRQAFETWHQEQRNQGVVFHFQKELLAYCSSDVRLLKQGCLTFKRMFEDLTGFNPFDHVTIASACNRDLRMNRMIPNSIASEPAGHKGWRNNINQSLPALQWLTWCDHQLRQRALQDLTPDDLLASANPDPQYIQHVRNEGEYKIPGTNFHVDGYCPDTHTVYEFQGCFTHGCPTCFPHRYEKHPRNHDRTMQDVYDATQDKVQKLTNQGYNVIQMWGCEWEHLLKTQPEIDSFVRELDFIEPLEPREAFCGGRTNAIKLYHHITPGQKIHYIDVTSLYPWVNKTSTYPKGHPKIIFTPGHTDVLQYFGLIQCKVLPPRELYHPVLPYRHDDKLLFPLCARCVEEEMAKPLLDRSYHCPHPDEQRALTSTWCSPELKKAVELGYQVQYIYEVWHFEQTCEGLFRDYVNTWLKIKQEASGWPKDDMSEEAKQDYIQKYFEKEGIQLEYNNIKKNPGLRTLAKLMLNSMWGKFGQRLNKTQIQAFDDPHAFHQFLDKDSLDVRHVSVVNDQTVEVHYQNQKEDIRVSPNLNIFVACFTTCHARLKLYNTLEALGERVLYFDTDSVIYLEETPTQFQPTLGSYLGDFDSELDDDEYIEEFVSGGPKNYGYTTNKGKVECKVRGFRLNSEGHTQLNYTVMRQNVQDEIKTPLPKPREIQVTKSHHIVRNPKNYTLLTKPQHKWYRLVYDKRVIDPRTFNTYPYGYQ